MDNSALITIDFSRLIIQAHTNKSVSQDVPRMGAG